MESKIYFAGSVPAALEVARKELGPDAVLVGSRPSPPEVKHFGRIEVTFAYDPQRRPARLLGPVHSQPTPHDRELDDIRRQLHALRTVVGALPASETAAQIEAGSDSFVAARLVEAGYTPTLAAAVAVAVSEMPGDPLVLAAAELARRIPVEPFVDLKPGESRTLAFIGPPGRGKTTAAVRIAITHGLARQIPVRLCSAGSHAIGAQQQIACYASLLGTPHLSFESLESLNLALNGEAWKGLTLIDTAGISPADQEELRELELFLARREEIDRHLVLRADASSADMHNVIARFTSLRPSRLLFTGTDETLSLLPMVETLMSAGIPGTFVCSGQRIPEDLKALDSSELAQLTLLRALKKINPLSGPERYAAAA
jgi:flagellar biosynthesis protein FlhF